jgi:PadR family transcriptional regulator, regulatory protein PadR
MAEGLGEFEQLVLLAILQLDRNAYAVEVRERIEDAAGRRVTRGALYATLDRLAAKDYVTWSVESATPTRGGIPRRCFAVTDAGVGALRRAQAAVRALSRGLGRMLREA